MIIFLFLDKSIPINGLSPVPRDQCAGTNIDRPNGTGLDMHPMYSSFRAAVVAAAPNAPSSQATHPPPPPLHSGKPLSNRERPVNFSVKPQPDIVISSN